MKTLKLRHLIDLVASDVERGEASIEKIFEWRFQRELTIVKWALGLAASLLIAILVAYFRATSEMTGNASLQNSEIDGRWVLVVALFSATYGVYRMARMRKLHEQYVAALTLYGRFKLIREFIQSYRRPQ